LTVAGSASLGNEDEQNCTKKLTTALIQQELPIFGKHTIGQKPFKLEVTVRFTSVSELLAGGNDITGRAGLTGWLRCASAGKYRLIVIAPIFETLPFLFNPSWHGTSIFQSLQGDIFFKEPVQKIM
jgi:hypothetical protein